jgi:hypothetical protein
LPRATSGPNTSCECSQISDADTTDSENDSDNIDLALGQKLLDPDGTSLGSVSVPAGVYTRIEFDLAHDCEGETSPSVIVENSEAGSPFETDDHITIKFEGTVNLTQSTMLTLDLGTILEALDTVTSDSEIKTALENAGTKGSF